MMVYIRNFIRFSVTTFLFVFFSCRQNINEPKIFHTYAEVENFLKRSKFSVDESASTGNKDWITYANYKSIDGNKGYLTLGMRGKNYYFKNVPLEIWEEFKMCESKGKFYHKKIKNRYNLKIE